MAIVVKRSVPNGTVTAPPSKSYTHRAMVLGALTHQRFSLRRPLISEDTRATLDALVAMGAEVSVKASETVIHCGELRPARDTIDALNSGTTARLVAGLASLLPSDSTITGDASLVRRPMAPLVDALGQLGGRCKYLGKQGVLPLRIGGPIRGSRTEIAGDVSSQFISSLIIACSQKKGDTEISVSGTVTSRPYIDITTTMLRAFGGQVREVPRGFIVPGGQSLARESYSVPGDFSSAAFPLCAAAITDGDVVVRNLDQESPQGDRAIVQHLMAFGAKVETGWETVRVRGGNLTGAKIDVRDTPDLFPVLAVVGAVAEGETVLTGGENLRAKESDRISTTTEFLQAMGATVKPTRDGCIISGGSRLHGALVSTHGDHRILMAAAVAALVSASETRIEDDDSYTVSYPGFLKDMTNLGCRMEVRR